MNGANSHLFKKRYSNAIGTCFFNQGCIDARNQANAQAQQELMQQQQLLLQIANQKVGGITGWAIAGIFVGLIAIGGAYIYYVKHKKIKAI